MASRFKYYPSPPESQECQDAFQILCKAHDAAGSFLDIFETLRKTKGAKGTTTDEQQDVLRAMLIFATAGLDSMVKQLVSDALPAVIDRDVGANEMFKQFVERRLRAAEGVDRGFLAQVLVNREPRQRLVNELVSDITSRSLLSTEELLRAAAYFNIPSKAICSDNEKLTRIFSARNQIAHEMDIDFDQPNRSRRPRAKKKMTEFANEVFEVSNNLLSGVDSKLRSTS